MGVRVVCLYLKQTPCASSTSTLLTKTSSDEVNLSSTLSHERFTCILLIFINWVVRALNADWLSAVVFLTVYYWYDKTFIFTALITLVTSL